MGSSVNSAQGIRAAVWHLLGRWAPQGWLGGDTAATLEHMRSLVRRIGFAAVFLLVAIIGIVAARTMLVGGQQLVVEPVPPMVIDISHALARLAGALRFPTVSPQDQDDFDPEPFWGLHAYLKTSFPRLHASLRREQVSKWSLLFTWRGENPDLAPIALLAHMDVVPVESRTESNWTYPPYSGRIADGYVWGRGALDMKSALIGSLEAVEYLLAIGFRPKRTIYLAFGHDEEIGGRGGARAIARLLASRGVNLSLTVDEGLAITQGIIPGVDRPVALLGIAEKGYLTLKLTASGKGGHSSRPHRESAIGRLARAIYTLEETPMPASLRPPVSDLFETVAPEMSLVSRVVIANRWLLEPVLLRRLANSPATNAAIRTTTAATIIGAGIKENLIPQEAEALVNFRLLPGDTIESVIEHVQEVVNDPNVRVERTNSGREASPVTPIDSPGFLAVARSVREIAPDAIVAPGLVIGGTDSKHYIDITDSSVRFTPLRLGREDLVRLHGVDERIAIGNYQEVIQFYIQLMRNAAG